jgi:ABC-type Mn2+/Zn2+ transport system permease subunit
VQALGNLLVVAILIGPAATARQLTCRLPFMMLTAGGIAITGSVGGLYLSYYGRLAAGASIAIVLVGGYLAALALRGLRPIKRRVEAGVRTSPLSS